MRDLEELEQKVKELELKVEFCSKTIKEIHNKLTKRKLKDDKLW